MNILKISTAPLQPNTKVTIEILYHDKYVVVASKPSGLLSVPGKGPEGQFCLPNQLKPEFGELFVVHRLDMATSGLMVLARQPEAHKNLSRQFAERTIGKRYTAVVSGIVVETSGDIALPLICDWPNRPKQKVCFSQGKPSLTHYRVDKRNHEQQQTRLTLIPVTGRSHQLRVHLQWLGHPIVGDEFYAPPRALNASDRLLLHADRLSFHHPNSGEKILISAPAAF